jgi:organic radical activating enzyme
LNVRLYEIFTSIEGEGVLYGTKTLFVRLAGCPFTCFYCDTTQALPMNSGTEYSIEQVCKLIDENLQENTYKVNFTGGDPLVQYEAVAEIAKYVQTKNISTYLESSCFDSKKFNHILPFINFVKIEFKTQDSEFVDDSKHYQTLIQNALECLKSSVSANKKPHIKIVTSSRITKDSFSNLVDKIFKVIKNDDISGFVIQPTYGISEPSLEQLLELYDLVYPKYKEVRIIPQLHKFIGAP